MVHKLHPTSAAGGETATQRSQRSKYTAASLPEPWLQKRTSPSLDSLLPNAYGQQLLGSRVLSVLLEMRTERRRAPPQQTVPPGHHFTQAWRFWWACNSVIQLVIKNLFFHPVLRKAGVTCCSSIYSFPIPSLLFLIGKWRNRKLELGVAVWRKVVI